MNVHECISLAEIFKKAAIDLPDFLQSKYIAVNFANAWKDNEYTVQYNPALSRLHIRYMKYDDCCWSDTYWETCDVGEYIDGERSDLEEEIEYLLENNPYFFLVALYKHSDVRYYPVPFSSSMDTSNLHPCIQGIFIPNPSFLKECDNNLHLAFERSKRYFEEFTDWCNGEVYTLCRTEYVLDTPDNLLFSSESDSIGGYIGYDYAKEALETDI